MFNCWGLSTCRIPNEIGTDGPLCLTEAIEPSEYSYFAPAVLASWAGPLHWKINNKQSTHLMKGIHVHACMLVKEGLGMLDKFDDDVTL